MKKIIILIVLISLLGHINAQTPDSATHQKMTRAWQYLHGVYREYSPLKAFELYKQCAETGNPEAMNAIGMFYKLGLETDKNNPLAVQWFEKAANAGYAEAWFNLGMMYKYAHGIDQDFVKAFECFKKAADMDCVSGYYGKGYMLYKGLGCEQNYSKAFELLKKGADKRRPSCMYLTGLCYRNGYGILRDTIIADLWLNKSARAGYKFAEDELAANEPENDPAVVTKSATIGQQELPSTFRRIKHNASSGIFCGTYTGNLVRYDWSGQHIISQAPLTIEFSGSGSKINGKWTEADSLVATIEGVVTDTSVVFTKATYQYTDHYNMNKPVTWQFKKALIEIVKSGDNSYLAGNLQLYSLQTMEPEKPIYISLKKEAVNPQVLQKNSTGNNLFSDLTAFPNPFGNTLNLSFVMKNTGDVRASIFNQNGNEIANLNLGHLLPGKQLVPIQLSVTAGTYVLKIYCNGNETTTIVVKQ